MLPGGHFQLLLRSAIELTVTTAFLVLVRSGVSHRLSHSQMVRLMPGYDFKGLDAVRLRLPALQAGRAGVYQTIHMQEIPQRSTPSSAGQARGLSLGGLMEAAYQPLQYVTVSRLVVVTSTVEICEHLS